MSAGGGSGASLFGIPRGDRAVSALLSAWFFLTICSYYILRPVRSSLFLASFGPARLPWVYMGTALATWAAVCLYAKCASFPRRPLIATTLAILASNLFLWWRLALRAEAARAAGSAAWAWTTPAFYVWVDVYSIMAVTLFWMVADEVFSPEGAKRVFGVLSAAGTAGGATGAWLAEALVPQLGTVRLLLVSALIFSATLPIFLSLEVLAGGRPPHRAAAAEPKGADLSKLADVVRLILSSRFLLFLTLVVLLERLVPDFADYLFQTCGKAAYPDLDAYTVFFASFEKWRNVAAVAAGLLLTAPILRLFGLRPALASVPATIIAGSTAFLLLPGLTAAVLLKGLEEAQRHTWFRAAKELAYTVTSHDVIYRLKGYVEMFFYRLARGVAGGLILLVVALAGPDPRFVAAAAVPLAALWWWCALRLSREYETLEARVSPDGP